MEKPNREKASLLKNAATAGLVFLAGGQVEAQDIGNWRTVTGSEFKRLHIPDSMIQKVSSREGMVPLDETKAARVYSDARTTFYWINPKQPKTKEEVLANTPPEGQKAISENDLAILKAKMKKEEALADIPKEGATKTEDKSGEVNKEETTPPSISNSEVEPTTEISADAPTEEIPDIEEKPTEEIPTETSEVPPLEEQDPAEMEMDTVMEKLEEYTNRFEVKEAYVTSSTGEEHSIDEIPAEAFKDPEDKTDLSGALIIHDKETRKEYEVRHRNKHGLTDGVFYFAEALKNSNARRACLELLTKQGKTELSAEEKIKYLQEFFTIEIEGLKEYKQPKISEELAFKN